MAELYQKEIDPVELSNRIHGVSIDTVVIDDVESSGSDANEGADMINVVYKPMSEMIELINTDNTVLNARVDNLSSQVNQLQNQLGKFDEIQKQMNNMRNMLLQVINENNALKKELSVIKSSRP